MGRGAGKWEGGGQARFTPLFRGSQKGFTLDLERGGGQKSLKVDIVSFGFFKILPEPHDIKCTCTTVSQTIISHQ